MSTTISLSVLRRGHRRPPSPRSLPHTLSRFAQDPCACVVELTQRHGDVVRLGFGGYVLISRPGHVRHVLETHHRRYRRGKCAHRSGGLFGEGLAYAEGEVWHPQRRMLMSALSPKAMPRYLPVMVDETRAVLERWKKTARARGVIDAKAELRLLAQNLIGGTMFQTDLRDQGAEIAAAMAAVGRFVGAGRRAAIHVPLKIPLPSNLRFRQAVRALDHMIFGLIEEARREDTAGPSLLSRLVRARDEETGETMDDRQIRDELVNVFLAGHEPSANALAFTLALLSRHPDVRLRVENEVREVLGTAPPRAEDLTRLVFLDRVIRESLRLYPPSWMMVRETLEDDVIGEFHLKRGTTLLISPFVTHRRPELWDDAERFDPDRHAPERRPPQTPYAWMPFGAEPRACAGQSFAWAELKVVLALIAQRCRLDLEPDRPMRPEPRLTLEPGGDLFMRPRWHD